MKYAAKSAIIDAMTFEEFIQYGIDSGAELVFGMPEKFQIHDTTAVMEDDVTYSLTAEDGSESKMTADKILIVQGPGKVYAWKQNCFDAVYTRVEPNEPAAA